MPTIVRAFRHLILIPISLLAVTAPAITLNLKSTGVGVDSYVDPDTGDYILGADETTFLVQETAPVSAAFDDAYIGLVSLGGTLDATIAYRDANNDNALNLTLAIASDTTVSGLRTIAGTWNFKSGLGDYQAFSTTNSVGQWSFSWNLSDKKTQIDVSGELKDRQAVPEPAPLAALGLGVVAIMRRKRR